MTSNTNDRVSLIRRGDPKCYTRINMPNGQEIGLYSADTVDAELKWLNAEIDTLRAERDTLKNSLARCTSVNINAEEGKPLEANATFQGEAMRWFAAHMAQWFRNSGGVNFVSLEATDPETKDVFEITMQRAGGETPAKQLSQMHAELDRLREITQKVDDHSYLLSRLKHIGADRSDLLDEINGLTMWALQRRVLIQCDWMRGYSKCLDGLNLNVGVDGSRMPDDIRRIVVELQSIVVELQSEVERPKRELDRLRELEDNVVNQLNDLGPLAVRVREGNGPEDLAASITVTIQKLYSKIRALMSDLRFANDAADKGDSARVNAGGMELRIKELEHCNEQLKAEVEAAHRDTESWRVAFANAYSTEPNDEVLRIALHFADNPRPKATLEAPADTMDELYGALRHLAGAYRRAIHQLNQKSDAPLKNTMVRIRDLTRSDPADFETAFSELRAIYAMSNRVLGAHGGFLDRAPESIPAAWRDVIVERERQLNVEGWTPEHDDEHDPGALAAAATAYALHAADVLNPSSQGDASYEHTVPPMWPWSADWWKPSGSGTNQAGARRDLIKAAALIFAEIEKDDRAAARATVTKRDAK